VIPSRKDVKDFLQKSEQLVEAIHGIIGQVSFEISGNMDEVLAGFYGDPSDLSIIESAAGNFYPNAITNLIDCENYSGSYRIFDFIPDTDAPFYKCHTTHKDFARSPLNQLVKIFGSVKKGQGTYHIVFRSLHGQYHDLIEEAIDSEFRAKYGAERGTVPSLQSGTYDRGLHYKSPMFKSYFAVNARIILPDESLSESVKAFISNYSLGSRPYNVLENRHYSDSQIDGMLNRRDAYHTGFLLNSHELTSFVHIPHEVMEDKVSSKIFAIAPPGEKPDKTANYPDVEIGKWICGKSQITIHLPNQREIPHVHIPGVSRSGKSVLLSHIAINKFKAGEAVFIFDPAGDLISNTLKMVPSQLADKVVMIDFGIKDHIPQITIRDNVDISTPSKASDDLTESMQDVGVNRNKFFGPKMAYIFQCLYYIYCVRPELNLVDIRLIVSSNSRAKALRTKIKSRISHPIIRDFLSELDHTPQEMLIPVVTVLSHLLLDDNSLRLFTQEKNKISIDDIMEHGKLCLINLSIGAIGKQRSSILSGVIDSLITNNALARSRIPYNKRKPCTVIKDEFYLGPGDLDNQLTGLAKYGLSVMFAHQYLDQVDGATREVMETAGTRIAFKLRRKDAEIMAKDFGVIPEEFTTLRKFEALVKAEDEVVKIATPRLSVDKEDHSKAIMESCLEKFYFKVDEEQESKEPKHLPYDRL